MSILKDFEIMRENINMVSRAVRKASLEAASEEFPVRLINEQQYRFVMLNERMHYPDFMDSIYDQVWELISDRIPNTTITDYHQEEFQLETDVFSGIRVLLRPYYSPRIDYIPDYKGNYKESTTSFRDGKLINPTITLKYPVNKQGQTHLNMIKSAMVHELTHVYDDYVSRSQVGDDVDSNLSYGQSYEYYKGKAESSNDPISTAILGLIYMGSKTEMQSFLAQAMHNLEDLGCNSDNYQKVMKQTLLYRNITTCKENAEYAIGNATDDDMEKLNFELKDMRDSNLPYMPIRDFKADIYRTMLLNRVDRLYHRYMKKYTSLVFYYLTEWNGGHMVKHTGRLDEEEKILYF